MCENGGIASPFLILELDVTEWSAARPGRFIPRGTATGTH
jgi:hypothetical protein